MYNTIVGSNCWLFNINFVFNCQGVKYTEIKKKKEVLSPNKCYLSLYFYKFEHNIINELIIYHVSIIFI